MMQGIVTAEREPVLNITVQDADGHEHSYSAVVDTGYTGWLTLPPSEIAALRLPWRERGEAMLADGNRILFDVYEAVVLWDGIPAAIPIDEADADPLLGMSLLYGYELLLPVLDGATFTVRRIVP